MNGIKLLLVAILTVSTLEGVSDRLPERSYAGVCSRCGATLVGASFLTAAQAANRQGKLLCAFCKKRMYGKKEVVSSTPQSAKQLSPAAFLFAADVFSPVQSPLVAVHSSPAPQFSPQRSASAPAGVATLSPFDAARLGARQMKDKRKLNPDAYAGNLIASEGFGAQHDVLVTMFEWLYSKKKSDAELAQETYSCQFSLKRRDVEVKGPEGKNFSFSVSKEKKPLLWKQGGRGVFLYTNQNGLAIRDFENDSLYEFPLESIPEGALKVACLDLGFDPVQPLSPYEEATRAYEAARATLPDPQFN